MIQEFVDRFMAEKDGFRARLSQRQPEDYREIVKMVIEAIGDDRADNPYEDTPDPERIHTIDDGEYQGTLVFVIAARGYQPSDYWYVKISYGSCSGCDTLEAIRAYSDDPPTPEQIDDYLTLALHIVQGLKKMGDDES